ncbi:hypothetical protein CH365_15515 [Leptospira neocaledonica]|uniref:Uncharacterized protein n=1 Tax=Leptospira neocaledonica TaxID=2023192 RepID=A0A2M9ZW09_9LEPT|nr:hypothetical protein CH365_15515 [Leptospira neocaledonica]
MKNEIIELLNENDISLKGYIHDINAEGFYVNICIKYNGSPFSDKNKETIFALSEIILRDSVF